MRKNVWVGICISVALVFFLSVAFFLTKISDKYWPRGGSNPIVSYQEPQGLNGSTQVLDQNPGTAIPSGISPGIPSGIISGTPSGATTSTGTPTTDQNPSGLRGAPGATPVQQNASGAKPVLEQNSGTGTPPGAMSGTSTPPSTVGTGNPPIGTQPFN